MTTQPQVDRRPAPIFGIASLAATMLSIVSRVALSDSITGVYAILVATFVGLVFGVIGGKRREAYRPISQLGSLVNGVVFLYVLLALFV
jgi:hypothetical protein